MISRQRKTIQILGGTQIETTTSALLSPATRLIKTDALSRRTSARLTLELTSKTSTRMPRMPPHLVALCGLVSHLDLKSPMSRRTEHCMVADFSLRRTRVILLMGFNSYSKVGHLQTTLYGCSLILVRLGE